MSRGRKRVVISWSTGKDCAWALHRVRTLAQVEIAGLLTTINGQFQRVSMHGVRRELAELQAQAAGLPLFAVELPWPCPNEEYDRRMAAACGRLRDCGVEAIVFGDIHLADVRAYRESRLAEAGMEAWFPLWGENPAGLIRDMLAAGLRAVITCLDAARLDPALAGAELGAALVESLPQQVDPCGENGEFHTFAFDGPMFRQPVPVARGEVVEREGYVYADLLPARPKQRRLIE
jgi:uncharacterized protein (TIGR00290 family)